MNCARVRSHLGDYLEGDLELKLRTQVDEHLGDCEHCAIELGELRSTIALLRSLPDPEPPVDLTNEIVRRIRAGEGQAPRTPAVVRRLLDPRVAAALAAGFAGLAIVTSIETSWVPAPQVVAVAPGEPIQLDQNEIDLWESTPPTLASTRKVQPRLTAIERTAANRFYRPDPRSLVVGYYGRVDPDLQRLDLDGELDRAKLDPQGFLRQLNEVAEVERPSRIAPLVVRAGRRGDAQSVAHRLRNTAHPLANTMAAEFDRRSAQPAQSAQDAIVVPASY